MPTGLNVMNKILFLFLLIPSLAFGAGDTWTANWDANTEPDLAEYEVLCGVASGTYTYTAPVVNNTLLLDTFLPRIGTYYCVVIAKDKTGNISGYSSEVSFTYLDLTPPANPTGLIVE